MVIVDPQKNPTQTTIIPKINNGVIYILQIQKLVGGVGGLPPSIEVSLVWYDGREYLRSLKDGLVYDTESEEHVGYWRDGKVELSM